MPIVKLTDAKTLPLPDAVLEALGLMAGDSVSLEIGEDGALMVRRVVVTEPVIREATTTLQQSIHRKNLQTPMQFIKGVGPKLAEQLAKKGISVVEDALFLLPHRYEDRRSLSKVSKLRPGAHEVFYAEVLSFEAKSTKGGKRFLEVTAGDESGSITLKWFRFNPVFMKKTWRVGRKGVFTGEVVQYGFQKEIHHPEVEWLDEGADLAALTARDPLNFGRILPVYPLTEGLHQKTLRKVMKEVIDRFVIDVENHLPLGVMERHHLMPLDEALRETHFPGHDADLARLNNGATVAHKTFSFDELFFLELGLALKRSGIVLEQGIAFQVTHKYTRELLKLLPFHLTDAQRRVLSEIKNDMMLPHPMHRLVQGDVGCGKTLVALMAALVAVENDYQVAIMAPTEILAEQHFLTIHRWCDALGIKVSLLTSGMKGKAKSAVLEEIAAGRTSIVIGTHAVIQEKVEFNRLGLGIIDEQHRFGVLQRGILKRKGINPDILVMTATPIPRTLAMTVFGDLSLSVIDELPPGRTPVETRVAFESRRSQVYGIIREEVKKGRQAYIIYPLVEETEKSELKAAAQMAEHLARDVFPELRVGLLHGRMKPEEKESVMGAFKARETDILVATTVIEVGIDVPNATVMVVEHAERFGLSQLHQLRGRVGRGSGQSRCILLSSGQLSEDGEKRLRVMESTNDGFRIAEADLEIRGPGDFLGTRQAGLPDFRVANILRDGRILEAARGEAFAVVERDPGLVDGENAGLRQELVRRWGGRLELAAIA
ncbi:ATP-dependent DNA helicase RecG [Geotalea daltonii FRC-32]|uniref:ATP-dependent DNA helicase RecG n=1 Tax=Geotalea daltonii (strain DSM 22248 / JCM 15807 / FRC-32) TaxID=316067 RepID=B9M0V4_GEODF|nr:ATP-dependent DNA helicase RecG [Geotalea daltonii]ACM20957.1 ATP-dependent DNA helicase RecG [Geotalea daltonii FRC-32]